MRPDTGSRPRGLRAALTGAWERITAHPTAGLPAAEAGRVADVVRAINAEGVTVLLVEHNMRVVMSISHDILVLNFGRSIAEGEPAAVRAHPEVIAAYLGTSVGTDVESHV